jgi:hypothetical protein
MKNAVEMGSNAAIYIPSFIEIGSGVQKFMGEIRRQHGDRIRKQPKYKISQVIALCVCLLRLLAHILWCTSVNTPSLSYSGYRRCPR